MRKQTKWLKHVKVVKKANPKLTLKKVLKKASKTYTKKKEVK